jgi:hypothetical protein
VRLSSKRRWVVLPLLLPIKPVSTKSNSKSGITTVLPTCLTLSSSPLLHP